MSNAPPATSGRSVAGFPDGAEGVTPPSNPAGTGGFLSDVIAELGFVDTETVERAVEAAREPGRMVDRILLENGNLTEEQLSRALAERYGLDHVDLDRFRIDLSAAGLISRTTALRYRAIPIAFATDGALIVAVADPVDVLAISDLEVMTRTGTRRAVACGVGIDALAERLPEVGTPQPSPPSSDTEPQSERRAPEENAPTATVEAEIGKLEAATRQSAVLPGPAGETAQRLEEPSQRAPASDGEADRVQAESEARIAALEAEVAKAYDVTREQAEQAEAENRRLREQAEAEHARLHEQAVEVAQERDRLREALDQVSRERDRLSAEAQQRAGDLTSVQERATRAESVAEEATGRIRELEDSDRRAEAARVALRELREESEREREQSSRLERKLREDLAAAEERGAALERRLDGLTAAASEAQAMAAELLAVNRAIAGDDIPSETDDQSESDGAPPSRTAQPQSPETNNGAARGTNRLGADIRKPTI